MLQQNPEQVEFAESQGNLDAVTVQDMGVEMQAERPESHCLSVDWHVDFTATTQDCMHSGEQFARAEGLGQIIVRPPAPNLPLQSQRVILILNFNIFANFIRTPIKTSRF